MRPAAAKPEAQPPILQVLVDRCEACGALSRFFLAIGGLFLCASCWRERTGN